MRIDFFFKIINIILNFMKKKKKYKKTNNFAGRSEPECVMLADSVTVLT